MPRLPALQFELCCIYKVPRILLLTESNEFKLVLLLECQLVIVLEFLGFHILDRIKSYYHLLFKR